MSSSSPVVRKIQSDAVKRAATNFLGMNHFSWIALAAAMLFFLGAGWIPDAITNMLLTGEENRVTGLIQMAGSIVVFLLFGWQIHRKIEAAEKIRVDVNEPQKAKVLVVFLSNISKPEEKERLFNAVEGSSNVSGLLKDTPWEMPYLALMHHVPRLEKLYIVTSRGERGTCLQYPHFARIIGTLFPGVLLEQLDDSGFNFEDIAQIHKVIDKFYDQYDNRPDYAKHDVIVDITGGQKTNSIAAAMATLAEGRRFQYVSTTDKKVQSYDLVIAG